MADIKIPTDKEILAEYSKPGVIDRAVANFNEQNPDHRMSPSDTALLKKDHALAVAVFDGGISDLIADGKTNVTKLEGKSPEFLSFLRHSATVAVVEDGVISLESLAKLTPGTLKKAEEDLGHGDMAHLADAAKLLGLDEQKTKAFEASVERAESPSQTPHHAHARGGKTI